MEEILKEIQQIISSTNEVNFGNDLRNQESIIKGQDEALHEIWQILDENGYCK